jgi:hypothetical protein
MHTVTTDQSALDNVLQASDAASSQASDLGRSNDASGEEARVRACLVCGLSLAGRRADARYCSGPCRAEASRLRAILSGSPAQRYSSIVERNAARHRRTQRGWEAR